MTDAADLGPTDKLAYTVDEAAAAMGLGRTTVFAMIGAGELTAKKLRGRTLVTRSEILRVLDAAPDARAA